MLRLAKDPGIVAKKKRKVEKVKKPVKRPLITVAKKDGEYTVTMETMKGYSKPRTLNQQPFEDKPVLTYTIGRTQEENRKRQKKKEREQRRLQRDQREFIQSAFADMCKEICIKTYQQALGFLPETEDPDCPCFPALPGPGDANLDRSCSCSEEDASNSSETDDDEWLVEFTPPNAHFDPTYKGKKIFKQDREIQYSYLDFRVKLLDRFGNQVARFFKGPDGKTQCSDLGGFWSPDHQWLEINNDGFIGPDDRWAPIMFIGPSGDQVVCESGKIQDADGTWLTVGVDGYVDTAGKWKYYPRSKSVAPQKKVVKKPIPGKKEEKPNPYQPSENLWSCFGDTNAKQLSKLGILGHGHDKILLLQRLTEMLKHGEDVKIPVPPVVPRVPGGKRGKREANTESTLFFDRSKCKHAQPSDKGIVAVDGHGNKTYFRLKDYKNLRPGERLAHLANQGKSTSSFHVPCLSSFINAEMLRNQQYAKFLRNQPAKYNEMEYGTTTKSRDVATQAQYRYRYAV